jgi:CRP/FNR family transcriptional regulator, cyclic AMP receptor protein
MRDFLGLADGLPRRALQPGETLIADGAVADVLFVLLDGAVRVEKGGTAIVTLAEAGVCIGEMALLLDVPATADVIAVEPTTVAVVDDARRRINGDAVLSIALARVLAARLHSMTTYLADLKQQYAHHEGGLGMVDTVLDSLMRGPASRARLASERDPDPEY